MSTTCMDIVVDHIEQIREEKHLGILANRWLKFHNHAYYKKAHKSHFYQSEYPCRYYPINVYKAYLDYGYVIWETFKGA